MATHAIIPSLVESPSHPAYSFPLLLRLWLVAFSPRIKSIPNHFNSSSATKTLKGKFLWPARPKSTTWLQPSTFPFCLGCHYCSLLSFPPKIVTIIRTSLSSSEHLLDRRPTTPAHAQTLLLDLTSYQHRRHGRSRARVNPLRCYHYPQQPLSKGKTMIAVLLGMARPS